MADTTQSLWKRLSLPSGMTLAFWQLRQSWRLLLLAGLGMLAAVVLVCSMPLYSRIALSAGLRSIIGNTPESAQIVLQPQSLDIFSSNEAADHTADYTQELQDDLGNFLSQPATPQVMLQTYPYPATPFTSAAPTGDPTQQISLQGFDMAQLASHVRMMQGRLPQPTINAAEIVLPVSTARELHISLGAQTQLQILWGAGQSTLSLRVVGLFEPLSSTDPFWHGSSFQPFYPTDPTNNQHTLIIQALTSNDTITGLVDHLQASVDDPTSIHLTGTQTWYYDLDTRQLDVTQLNDLLNGLGTALLDLPVIASPNEDLIAYQNRVMLVETPVILLVAIITGMVLCFVGMIASLLVENRNEAIAILRSRGASQRQIFSTFMVQQIALGLIAVLCGPLCAFPVVNLLAHITLSGNDQGALNLLTDHPFTTALSLEGFAGITALTAVLAGLVAIKRAVRFDVLALRRRDTRSSTSPLWQRLYLDLFAALLALSGYGIALYESSAGTLDAQTQVFVLAPLILLTAVCALLAGIFLFLRILPLLLDWFARLAANSNSAVPTLALAQLTRAPRQVLGTTLLLSFTTAFAVFTLFFTASQTQHVIDLATYQSGADFSGQIVSSTTGSLAALTAHYQRINGVAAASVGYTGTLFTSNGSPVGIKAIDPGTFGQTIFWSDQYSSQPLDTLLYQLRQHRQADVKQLRVPAIVDATTWDRLKLVPGKSFSLANNTPGVEDSSSITFVALIRISHIPTLSNGNDTSQTRNEGILVDYQTYSQVYNKLSAAIDPSLQTLLTPNYFWLRVKDDAGTFAATRAALQQNNHTSNVFYDRHATINVLYHDPLYLNLIGILALGALTPLLLALIGSLVNSRLNVEQRLNTVTILRALGSAPKQILSILTWEQGPIYTLLLLLGVGTGWLLSALALPALIVAGISTQALLNANSDSGSMLDPTSLPGIRIVIPSQALIALAVLVLTILGALVLVIRTTVRPALKQIARLNEE